MDKYESIPLELPNDYVTAFNGFALDIGKLIYFKWYTMFMFVIVK